MTPEQRAFVVSEIEAMAEAYVFEDGCVDCASCAAMQAALSALTEEAERDQRLGAAVRKAINQHWDASDALTLRGVLRGMAMDCARECTWSTPSTVLNAIADALESEKNQ